jgi:hypothetical protein
MIVMQGIKKDQYEYGVREYVGLLLDHNAGKLPYWLKLALGELYCTLRVENGQLQIGYSPAREFRGSAGNFRLSELFSLGGGVDREKGSKDFYADTGNRSGAFGAQDGLGGVSASLAVNYPVVAWELIHMMMFKKEYGPKFGAFLDDVSKGDNTVAAFGKIYDQSLTGVDQDLRLYMKMPTHAVAPLKFPVEAVTPQVTALSPADSAPILAELKAAR